MSRKIDWVGHQDPKLKGHCPKLKKKDYEILAQIKPDHDFNSIENQFRAMGVAFTPQEKSMAFMNWDSGVRRAHEQITSNL